MRGRFHEIGEEGKFDFMKFQVKFKGLQPSTCKVTVILTVCAYTVRLARGRGAARPHPRTTHASLASIENIAPRLTHAPSLTLCVRCPPSLRGARCTCAAPLFAQLCARPLRGSARGLCVALCAALRAALRLSRCRVRHREQLVIGVLTA